MCCKPSFADAEIGHETRSPAHVLVPSQVPGQDERHEDKDRTHPQRDHNHAEQRPTIDVAGGDKPTSMSSVNAVIT